MAIDLSRAFRLKKRPWWRPTLSRPTRVDWEAYGLRLFVAILVMVMSIFFLFFIGMAGLGLILGSLTLMAIGGLVIWVRPWWGMVLLVTLVPPHPFLMMLIFNFTRSGFVTKLAQIWKEGILVVLLLKALHLTFKRRQAPRMTLLDLLIICYVTLTLLYIFFPSSVGNVTLLQKVFGARTDMSFLLPIFLARGLGVTRRQVQILLGITIVVSLLVAGVAIFQVAAPGLSNAAFEYAGYSKYVGFQTGSEEGAFAVRQREVSGLRLTRAASLLLGDLALSFYQLMTVPLALALLLVLPGLKAKILGNLYLLLMLGILSFTVTRSAIIAGIVACGVIILWRRRVSLIVLIVVEIAVLLAGLAFYMELTPDRLVDLFSPEESSSRGHLEAWRGGWELLKEDPWGGGLGTSGTNAQRFGSGFTPESWYFQIANEMGFGQALLFVAITAVFALVCFWRYEQLNDPWLKALSLGMGGGVIGFAAVGLVLHAWEALALAMLFWFLGGIVLAAPEIERQMGADSTTNVASSRSRIAMAPAPADGQ